MSESEYLVIGHVALDVVPGGYLPGGTVAYAGMTAHALGYRTRVLTSAGPGTDVAALLPGLEVHVIAAGADTVFENLELPEGRRQILHGRAAPLRAEDVPAGWLRPDIVHLGPIAAEVEPNLLDRLQGRLVGLTPQGWLRGWDASGRVEAIDWPLAEAVFPRADAVILSEEDLVDEAQLARFRASSSLLVMTQGVSGCTVFWGEETRHLPAPRVFERAPTGAGDVFAAAFLTQLQRTGGDAWAAARFANQIASATVTKGDLPAKARLIARLVATASA